MILTNNIIFKNFKKKKNSNILKKKLYEIIKNKSDIVLNSLTSSYDYSYSNNLLTRLKKNSSIIRVIGMGGSILGTRAIYKFLQYKIKKKVYFVDNLKKNLNKDKSKKILNLIISKSGNTLETITNANLLLKKSQKNVFITQDNSNYLRNLAQKLKSEIIDHNNYIGGRYSVLSEVGMLPAELFGLDEKKFKQFNNLVKNKNFINSLVSNTAAIIFNLKRRKNNSIIINFDENSDDFFKWYQQLVAESLGKNGIGIYPLISTMPKDNHSLMQLYLDGPKQGFYTLFHVRDKKLEKLNNNMLLESHRFLKNKSINQILNSQKNAIEIVFKKKKIPFRSFEIIKKDEKTLGELFTFFILETILLGKALNINPYNQPAVELIKKETKKNLFKK